MRRGSDIICSLVLAASHTNRVDCGPLRMKITDNRKLVHVYFGDSDPYAVAEVNRHICMAIGYYFLPELITGDHRALK